MFSNHVIPAVAVQTILANGVRFLLEASSEDITNTAAAPSLIPEAFPAVTVPVPSLTKAGLSLARVSAVVSGLGNSSVETRMEGFLGTGTETGAISEVK